MANEHGMNETETPAERDRRIRGEEARTVRIEERLAAVHELLIDERSKRGEDRRALTEHQQQDEQRFTSIDSRLQGQQTQLTQMAESLIRIERSLTGDGGVDQRLRKLETVQGNWSAGWKALTAAAAIGAAIATVAGVLVQVLA